MYRKILFMLLCVMTALVVSPYIYADSFTGTSYKIDASVMNSFGGSGSSTSYGMTSSGGESIIGQGLGGSYLLSQGYVSQLNQSLQLTVQPPGLTTHLNFDENIGPTAYDWTANNNNATNSAGNNMTWATGKRYNSVDQALTSGHLETSTTPISGATNSFTAEGWFNPATTASGMVLMGQDDNTGTGDKWKVVTNASGSVTFILQKAGTTVSATGSTALTPSIWQHIAVNYDGATMKLFLNGVLLVQQSNPAGAHTFSLPLALGDYNSPAVSSSFNGKIDEVRVYNRALGDREVFNNYHAQNSFSDAAFVTIPAVTPGTSSQIGSDVFVQTDAPGYNLAIRQFTNLNAITYTGNTIPAISSGSIASPVPWTEGTTKGLGFTLTGAPSLDSKWGTSPNYNYAPLSTTATTFYTKSGGSTSGQKEAISMQYRVDVNNSQVADNYRHLVNISGTVIP
jgi:Concanavalin A-like lectin/glucanases superfamily